MTCTFVTKASKEPQEANKTKKPIPGIIQLTRKGVGYLPWPIDKDSKKEKEDIEISPEHLFGALDGDTVEVELAGLFPRPKGKVVKIISRAKTEFVATMRGGV